MCRTIVPHTIEMPCCNTMHKFVSIYLSKMVGARLTNSLRRQGEDLIHPVRSLGTMNSGGLKSGGIIQVLCTSVPHLLNAMSDFIAHETTTFRVKSVPIDLQLLLGWLAKTGVTMQKSAHSAKVTHAR